MRLHKSKLVRKKEGIWCQIIKHETSGFKSSPLYDYNREQKRNQKDVCEANHVPMVWGIQVRMAGGDWISLPEKPAWSEKTSGLGNT